MSRLRDKHDSGLPRDTDAGTVNGFGERNGCVPYQLNQIEGACLCGFERVGSSGDYMIDLAVLLPGLTTCVPWPRHLVESDIWPKAPIPEEFR
mgnify:CR=1 FL=1